jgi:DNA-binding transcriptional MocR family regulator
MLQKSPAQSLTEQLAERFAQRIRTRLLAPGARLPSVRQCAALHKVSPSTVVAAYDQLLAHGLIDARKNRGFFVRETTSNTSFSALSTSLLATEINDLNDPNTNPLTHASPQPAPQPLNASANATALIRGMFHGISNKPQPGMGVLPAAWLQTTFLSAAVRKVTTSAQLNAYSLQYGEPLGDGGLRRALATRLGHLNIPVSPEHIITTLGATHALDIVSRTLLRAGDHVMVEEPGWAVEFARLTALGMRVLPVPRGPAGPDLTVMARYCEIHAPKLFVSVSVFHNPTGYTLSPGSAHQILQLANRHDFHIVEDDTYSHLAPEHATRLCALDGLQRTLYVSGFAKILAPNWRVGYLAAPAHWVERLLDTKLLSALTTPALLEKAIAVCIEQGQLRRHAERIRTQLDAARARSVKLALAHGCTFASDPAGLFGWIDTGVDTDTLAQRMLDEGYLLAPGALFHAERQPSTLMRINFTTTQDAAFWQVFARLRDAQ